MRHPSATPPNATPSTPVDPNSRTPSVDPTHPDPAANQPLRRNSETGESVSSGGSSSGGPHYIRLPEPTVRHDPRAENRHNAVSVGGGSSAGFLPFPAYRVPGRWSGQGSFRFGGGGYDPYHGYAYDRPQASSASSLTSFASSGSRGSTHQPFYRRGYPAVGPHYEHHQTSSGAWREWQESYAAAARLHQMTWRGYGGEWRGDESWHDPWNEFTEHRTGRDVHPTMEQRRRQGLMDTEMRRPVPMHFDMRRPPIIEHDPGRQPPRVDRREDSGWTSSDPPQPSQPIYPTSSTTLTPTPPTTQTHPNPKEDTTPTAPGPPPKKRRLSHPKPHLDFPTTSKISPTPLDSPSSITPISTTEDPPTITALAAEDPTPSPQEVLRTTSSRTRKMVELDVACSAPSCPHIGWMALCLLHGAHAPPLVVEGLCGSCLGAGGGEGDEVGAGGRRRGEGGGEGDEEGVGGRRRGGGGGEDEEGAGGRRRGGVDGRKGGRLKRKLSEEFEGNREGRRGVHCCALCKEVVGRITFGEEEGEFHVETICPACRSKYSFCTECGGGGRYRTGKWRPQELFSSGRRTCSLSHIRIGTAPLEFEVLALPEEVGDGADSIIEECREVFEDCYYAASGVPEMMEKPTTSLTFDDVKKSVTEEFTFFANTLRGTLPTSTGTATKPIRRYLAISCIPQTRKKRGRIVADDPSASLPRRREPKRPLLARRTVVACATAEYNVETGVLVVMSLTIRVPTLQQGAIDGEVICSLLDRVEADCEKSVPPSLESSSSSPSPSLLNSQPSSSLPTPTPMMTPTPTPKPKPTRPTRRPRSTTNPITEISDTALLPNGLRRPFCVCIAVPSVYPRWKAQLARLGFMDRGLFEARFLGAPLEGVGEVWRRGGEDGEGFEGVFSTFDEVRAFTVSRARKKGRSRVVKEE
ncbi:hypothetical protein HDU67_004132 [Dinochytrium kinnereticum]|nr:hypothetical protein HDU67_004132 [Dinochytrium kinnereticum]